MNKKTIIMNKKTIITLILAILLVSTAQAQEVNKEENTLTIWN